MMPAAELAAHVRQTFGRLADAPIWVAWQDEGGRKLPINPRTGGKASTIEPATWASAGQAIQFAAANALAGVGVVLGPDPDQNPSGAADRPWLVGVDYDNALRPDGSLMPWAQEFFAGDSYAEVSPSGNGVKVFGMVAARPEGIPDGQDGAKLRLEGIEPATSGKRPGIEVYCGRRWFAVTGNHFRTSPKTLGDIGTHFPRFAQHFRAAAQPAETGENVDAYAAYSQPLSPADHATAARLLHQHSDLEYALTGRSRDPSVIREVMDRSTLLWHAADLAKGYRLPFSAFVHIIMGSSGPASEHVREQPDALRALTRAWQRSPQPQAMDRVPPVGPVPVDDRVVAADLSALDIPNPLGAPTLLPEDLYSNPPPLPRFILDGYLPAAPTVMVGTGGTFKSSIWMTRAVMMLLAIPVWGRQWWQGGSALMVSREDEYDIMLRRLHDILHSMGVTERQYRDIIRHRMMLDDRTAGDIRFVAADRAGNLHTTPTPGYLIDKYRDRGVTMLAIDPLVNFGPGEVHGNDGAAAMMRVGWDFCRGFGRCCTTFIHHISMSAARDEIEDAHAGRSASAIGDNARAVEVLHRHKTTSKHKHRPPAAISQEAIDAGRVIRMTVAKQSYAALPRRPMFIERVGDTYLFHEPDAELAPDVTPAGGLTERQEEAFCVNRDRILGIVRNFGGRVLQSEMKTLAAGATAKNALAALIAEGSLLPMRDDMGRSFFVLPPEANPFNL